VIGSDGCYLEEEMDMEKRILLVKDHEVIFDASRCKQRNRDYIASVWQKIAQEMGVGKTSASMFISYFDDGDIHNMPRPEYGRRL